MIIECKFPENTTVRHFAPVGEERTEEKKNDAPPVHMNTETVKRELEHKASLRQQQVLDDYIISDLCWEALLQAGKGNKEQAMALVEGKSRPVLLEWKSHRPRNIEFFFDQLAVDFLRRKPQKLNSIGLLESIGVRDHNRHLNDYSLRVKYETIETTKKNLKDLKSYDVNSLTPDQHIAYKILLWWLNHDVEGEAFHFHEYPINQMFGPLNDLTETFTLFHKLEVKEDFETYLKRLSNIAKQFEQIKTLISIQQKKGITPPKFALERVLGGLKTFIGSPITANPFYQYIEKHSELLQEGREPLLQQARQLIETQVLPAYTDFVEFLTDFTQTVATNHSLLGLPRGKEYYAYCLKYHTTTDLTPEKVYQLGLQEVESIQCEMRLLLASVGIEDDKKTVGELMTQLTEDENLFYPNTNEGKEACIQGFQTILERSRRELSQYFNLKPDLPLRIVPTPAHEEEGMPGAYYFEPSLDGSRPGTFYVNLRDTKELPKFGMQTLLVHEGEPGHHFQLTLQAQSKMPLLCKLSEFNAYIEGWALYAEKLAYEKGFYTSAHDKLGHLQDELLRAVRLVVDPAIHTKGWSREEAIDYMQKQTGYQRESVVTEIERYFIMPGQACSYKIGQLKILELRKRAMEKLGPKFDIRKFHDVVLKVGACPLSVLEEEIEKYINSR